jgi:hypothetical protein
MVLNLARFQTLVAAQLRPSFLSRVGWQYVTDVSWQPILFSRVFESSTADCLVLKGGVDMLHRNVVANWSTPCNILEDQRPRGGSWSRYHVCPWRRGGIGIISPHCCSTTPVHGGRVYESLGKSAIVSIVRFIRFWNDVLDLRLLCGEYEDYRYLGCDAVWFGGCQLLGGCSALKLLRSKCCWPHLPDNKASHPNLPSNTESRCIRVADVKSFSWNSDITSVAVLCFILSHELSKLGSNRASCLGRLGFDLRPKYGQVFRIFLFTSVKFIWSSETCLQYFRFHYSHTLCCSSLCFKLSDLWRNII